MSSGRPAHRVDRPFSSIIVVIILATLVVMEALSMDYTVIFVTHTLRQARRIADNVIFLYMGEVVEEGSAESFFTQPKSAVTKAYLEGAFS